MTYTELIEKYPSLKDKDVVFNILDAVTTMEESLSNLTSLLNLEIDKHPTLKDELYYAKEMWGGYEHNTVGFWLIQEKNSEYLSD